MLNRFIRGNVHHQEDDDEPWSSPSSTPRKSSKNSHRRSHNKEIKNPYSTRGLDKFSSLLADLEEKRHEIISQKGSKDISLVRFVYSDSNDCVPIVVKSKEKNQEKTKLEDIKEKPETKLGYITEKPVKEILDKFPIESTITTEPEVKQPLESDKKTEKKSFSMNIELYRWRSPSYYLPVVIVLILLFMAVFGRSGAILCVSFGWYMVPTLNGESSNVKKPIKKKEYARRLSENKMVSDGLSSPRSNTNSGAVKNKTPRQRGNSW